MLTEVAYDAVVLDLVLPKLRRPGGPARGPGARQVSMPVLVLTARGSVHDRVQGLDAGADDYLIKPFAMAELLGRVRALVRRVACPSDQRSSTGRSSSTRPAHHNGGRPTG